jgi:uncharacterized protein DUF4124
MRRRLLTASAVVLICGFASPKTHADIYAWVDASGAMTLSDLPPPPGVRVVNVVNERTPGVPARAAPAPARDPNHDVGVLAERIRQLERQIEVASYQPPPPVTQYAPTAPSYGYDCAWADCGPWWSQLGYPVGVGVVVVPSRGFRHFHRFHGTHRFVRGASSLHHH